MADLFTTMTISSHGMRAQGERIRVVAETLRTRIQPPAHQAKALMFVRSLHLKMLWIASLILELSKLMTLKR